MSGGSLMLGVRRHRLMRRLFCCQTQAVRAAPLLQARVAPWCGAVDLTEYGEHKNKPTILLSITSSGMPLMS